MLLRWCLGSLELSAATKPAPASSSPRWQTIFDLQVRLMKVEPQVLLGLSSECLNERRCPELRRGQLAIKVVASVWLSSTPAPAQCGYHTWNCTQCGYHTENCTRSFRQHLRGAARLPITHSAVNTSPAAELRGYECGGNCSHRVWKRVVSVTAATCTRLPSLQAVANCGPAVVVENPSGVL